MKFACVLSIALSSISSTLVVASASRAQLTPPIVTTSASSAAASVRSLYYGYVSDRSEASLNSGISFESEAGSAIASTVEADAKVGKNLISLDSEPNSFDPTVLVGMDRNKATWMATAQDYRIVSSRPNQIVLVRGEERLILDVEPTSSKVRSARVEAVSRQNSANDVEVLAFQTSNYAVKVFRRGTQLLTNVFNKPSGVLILSAAPTREASSKNGVGYQTLSSIRAEILIDQSSGQKRLKLTYGNTVIDEPAF